MLNRRLGRATGSRALWLRTLVLLACGAASGAIGVLKAAAEDAPYIYALRDGRNPICSSAARPSQVAASPRSRITSK